LFPLARIWWLSTQRRWRQNSFLLAIALGISATHGYHTWGLQSPAQLTLLFGVALGVAMFLPALIRTENILANPRFTLLPYTPRFLFLLQPVFGNPLRFVLAASALTWGAVGLILLGRSAAEWVLELPRLLGWTLVGLALAEVIEQWLRRRASVLVYMAAVLAGISALRVLVGFASVRAVAGELEQHAVGPWRALLLGGGAPLAAKVLTTAVLAAVFGLLLRGGRKLVEGPEVRREARSWTARLLAWLPVRPALAKELAMVLRVVVLRISYLWIPLVTAAALYGGAPFLLAGLFLWWIGAAYNLLGPDVPRGGLVRYQLLPRSLASVFRARHAAIVLVSVILVGVAVLLVGIGGVWRPPRTGPPSPLAYPLWGMYGMSLFLLFTVTSDRISLRYPRTISMRGVIEEGTATVTFAETVLRFLSLAGTAATAAAILAGWVASSGLLTGVLLAALTHAGIYALHLRTHLHRG
jgi:hypothetical protein